MYSGVNMLVIFCDTESALYDAVPILLSEGGARKSIRVVVDTLYFDSAIVLSDGLYYPTTPCIPELIEVVDAALEVLDVKDDYSVSCVLLHANMGGADQMFDWTNPKKKYIIYMKEIHGSVINLELRGISYDRSRNKILLFLSIIRRRGDLYGYYLRSR